MMNLSVVIDLAAAVISLGSIAFIYMAGLRFLKAQPEPVRIRVKKENRDNLR